MKTREILPLPAERRHSCRLNASGPKPTGMSALRSQSGFTMVEIALCLAIIGFALVAIIGVLPTGMNVQKNNREETIINQDAAVWMDAIRNGARGYDDLTNYVLAITNYVWSYTLDKDHVPQPDTTSDRAGPADKSPETIVFARTFWMRNGLLLANDPMFLLTNGLHIVGALSRPRIEWTTTNHFFSNYIVANVRAMSGSAVEKFPQDNPAILDSAFGYRMIAEIESYVPFDTNLIHSTMSEVNDNAFDPAGITNTQPQAYWDNVRDNRRVLGALYKNSHDLRLTFRWPLLPSGAPGNGLQTFRAFVGGQLLQTNDPTPGVLDLPLYFLQPSTYGQGQ